MEHDQLTCIQCGLQWNRLKARGRKPKLCPSCLQAPNDSKMPQEDEDDQVEEIPVTPEPPPARTKYRPNTKWSCSSCGVSIKIGIGINDAPTHSCKKRLKKIFPLELQ
jgi:hypothetical protein